MYLIINKQEPTGRKTEIMENLYLDSRDIIHLVNINGHIFYIEFRCKSNRADMTVFGSVTNKKVGQLDKLAKIIKRSSDYGFFFTLTNFVGSTFVENRNALSQKLYFYEAQKPNFWAITRQKLENELEKYNSSKDYQKLVSLGFAISENCQYIITDIKGVCIEQGISESDLGNTFGIGILPSKSIIEGTAFQIGHSSVITF